MGPISFNFQECYLGLNEQILSLKKLVSNPSTRRPIAFLSIDELRNISAEERNLLDIYNNEADKSPEELVEIDNIVEGIFKEYSEGTVNSLREEIDQKVKSIFEDGDFLGDLKLSFNFNGETFKNYQSDSAMKLIIKRINRHEDQVLDEKKKVLKSILKNYFIVRRIVCVDNGEVINPPQVEVW